MHTVHLYIEQNNSLQFNDICSSQYFFSSGFVVVNVVQQKKKINDCDIQMSLNPNFAPEKENIEEKNKKKK